MRFSPPISNFLTAIIVASLLFFNFAPVSSAAVNVSATGKGASVGISANSLGGLGSAMLSCAGKQTLSSILSSAKNALLGGGKTSGVDMTGSEHAKSVTEKFNSGEQAKEEAQIDKSAFGPETGGADAAAGATTGNLGESLQKYADELQTASGAGTGEIGSNLAVPESGLSDATQAASNAAGGGLSGIASGAMGVADKLVSGATNLIGQQITNFGVFSGSQAIESVGKWLNGAGAEGLSGILGGAGVVPGLSMISGLLGGGGGPVPVADKEVKENVEAVKKKQTCLDAIANATAKNMLAQLNGSVLKWINTGFNGDPFYPKNLGGYYQDIAKNQTNILLGQISKSNSPFASQIIPSVIKANQNETSSSFSREIKDSLAQVAGGKDNADAFRGGNPSECPGLLLYKCLEKTIFSPGSSLVGTQVAVRNRSEQDQAKAKSEAAQELTSGSGFVSQKKCVDERVNEETGDKYCFRYETVTPGSLIKAPAEKAATAGQSTLEGPVTDPEALVFLAGAVTETALSGVSGATESRGAYSDIGSDFQKSEAAVSDAESRAIRYLQTIQGSLALTEQIVAKTKEIKFCFERRDNLTGVGSATRPSLNDPAAAIYQKFESEGYSKVISGYKVQSAGLREIIGTLDTIRARIGAGASEAESADLASAYGEIADNVPTPSGLDVAINDFQMLQDKESITSDSLSECLNKLKTEAAAKNNSSSGSSVGGL